MTVKSFRDLNVWQLAMDLAQQVYKASRSLPQEEQFGLMSQMRRAAVSVPSNIAEGQGRGSDRDFSRYLSISIGSLSELETQLVIAERMQFLGCEPVNDILKKIEVLTKKIYALKVVLRNS